MNEACELSHELRQLDRELRELHQEPFEILHPLSIGTRAGFFSYELTANSGARRSFASLWPHTWFRLNPRH